MLNRIKKADMKKLGLWSMAGFEACIKCGKTEKAHNAKGLCKRCYYQTEEQHLTQKIYRNRLKRKVIDAYGGKCKCCGEKEIAFLAIDHIDGCGGEKRKLEPSGSPIYIFLKARKYPKGYQILCHNCNMAKEMEGGCPHERKAN